MILYNKKKMFLYSALGLSISLAISSSAFATTAIIDSDGDGLSDAIERHYNWNYLDKTSPGMSDIDKDGVPDRMEFLQGSNLYIADSVRESTSPYTLPLSVSSSISKPLYGSMLASSGNILTGNYFYFDLEGDKESNNSQHYWKIYKTKGNGAVLRISTGNANSNVQLDLGSDIVLSHIGERITYCVTPKNIIGETGKELCSAPSDPIIEEGEYLPEASNVQALSVPDPVIRVGESSMIGIYEFNYAGDNVESGSVGYWFSDFNNENTLLSSGDTRQPEAAINQRGEQLLLIESNRLKYCVVPKTVDSTGFMTCSEWTTPVLPRINDRAPSMTAPTITGNAVIAATIVGNQGEYSDEDFDLKDNVSIEKNQRWVRVDGNLELSQGNDSFTPGVELLNKSIKYCATPHALTGEKEGDEVCSDPINVGPESNYGPVVIINMEQGDIDGSGQLNSNDFLIGRYVDTAESPTESVADSLEWFIMDGVKLEGPTSVIMLGKADEGKAIRYCVKPINANGVSGDAICSDDYYSEEFSVIEAQGINDTLKANTNHNIILKVINNAGKPVVSQPIINNIEWSNQQSVVATVFGGSENTIESGYKTDANGNLPLTVHGETESTSDGTATFNAADYTKDVTFESVAKFGMCGGKINDTDPINVGGECLKVSTDYKGNLFTSTPSEAVINAQGYANYTASYEGGDTAPKGLTFMLFDWHQAVSWCEELNTIDFVGKTNWRMATKYELLDFIEQHTSDNGNLLNDGWPSSLYWSKTESKENIGRNYDAVSFLWAESIDNISVNNPLSASCISAP